MQRFAAHFEFTPADRLINVVLSGEFSLGAVERARSQLTVDPQFDPSFRRCYDLRALSGIPDLPPSMRGFLADFMAFDPVLAKRALVLEESVMTRLGAYIELADPGLIRMFTSLPDAQDWLLAP